MMLPRARHEYLLRQLALRGSVRASDVAAALGVTQVTVRRDIAVLADDGLLARVHGGAIALDDAARKPAAARTLVGVVVPSATEHFAEIMRGMQTVAEAARIRLVLSVSDYRPDVERARLEQLLDLEVAGLIIAPTTHRDNPEALLGWLESVPVPTVALERLLPVTAKATGPDSVRTDHVRGVFVALSHLADLGHTRIALGCYDRTPNSRWVREGYRDAVGKLVLDEAPQFPLPKGNDDPDALADALDDMLAACRRERATAVLVHSDYHAARLVERAHRLGIEIPDELAVVAYDDELAAHAAVPLTAITFPKREVGRQAVRLVTERIAPSDDGPPPARHIQLVPRLSVRESCGAATVN
ncbi:LacI family DNA-binding transcriptional regulator [Ruania halotolerans]|uniref:LacI family DNA-binding transcriptional regulator n=1 Tax=Ruania halotolerans TaxID=2897773 RepID=UPI001E2E529B|nr:LacI family DNA-binding transcriptional regulator [Ruania halotolerans]UFU07817.1 LacI family transcriptional regulator [Ruania halotolerans]